MLSEIRRFTMPLLLGLVLIMGAAPALYAAEPLLAGVAVSSITPDTEKLHVPLGGYGERQNAAAEGVHDNIMAKALILKQGEKKYALVTKIGRAHV